MVTRGAAVNNARLHHQYYQPLLFCHNSRPSVTTTHPRRLTAFGSTGITMHAQSLATKKYRQKPTCLQRPLSALVYLRGLVLVRGLHDCLSPSPIADAAVFC
jgi:hypothetical protein